MIIELRPNAEAPPDAVASAGRLLDETQQGARANDRPDLLRQLADAQQQLDRSGDIDGVLDVVLRALDSLTADLRSRRCMLADPARAARLRTELADLQLRRAGLDYARGEWPHLLGDGLAAVESDIEFALFVHVRTMLGEAEQLLRELDPAKAHSRLAGWLRARMLAETKAIYALAGSGAERVAGQLGALFGPGCAAQPQALAVRPAPEVTPRLSDAVPSWGGGYSVSERLLAVLMPCYGGVMMTVVLTRFIDAPLPGWLIALCAVAAALCLGGAALNGDRTRARENRRAASAAEIRATLEEFQFGVGKQVRDGLRARHAHLRRWATAELDHWQQVLDEELAGTGAEANTAERMPAELDDIADDLATIGAIRTRAANLRTIVRTS